MPTNSKEASSAQALTDAYLDSIGLGKRSVTEYGSGHPGRQTASPAPIAASQQPQQQEQHPQQQQPQQTGYAPQNQMSPQQTGYYQQQPQNNGPRAPPAPIPLNQQLLNPLIPTQTGMTGFIPTRNQQSPMPMMPQHTSFQQPMQQPMQTGYPGQSPFGNQFAVQQQPQQQMMQQPQYGGMMQSQPTGYPLCEYRLSRSLYFCLADAPLAQTKRSKCRSFQISNDIHIDSILFKVPSVSFAVIDIAPSIEEPFEPVRLIFLSS